MTTQTALPLTRQQLGAAGERIAAAYLAAQGFTILTRNWHCRYGELDIVAREAGTVVAVEVKSRRSLGHGHPFEAITPAKVARLRRLLAHWQQTQQRPAAALRVDAVSVLLPPGSRPEIEHLRGIS